MDGVIHERMFPRPRRIAQAAPRRRQDARNRRTRHVNLDRASDGDVPEADAATERLAAVPADEGLVIREIWLLRLRALLARTDDDDAAYTHLRDRYRDMAKTLGFEGHIAWAEAMP